MKFSTYTPTVSPNTLHNVGITPTQASRDLNAYGGRGGGEQLGALANVAKMGLALQQKVADGKALEANAEYNRLMSEGTSALMQKKEGEALTITDEYDKLQKSVLEQVNKKYGGYLYGDARESFNAYTMRDDATRRAGVVKYQTAQTDAYRETQYNNQLAECRNAAIEGGGNIEAVGGALNRMEAVVESRFGAYGGEKLIEQKRIAAGQIVGDAVNMAINSGDYAKAESLLSTYKGMLPTNDYIEAKTKLKKQQEIRDTYSMADRIAAQARGADGKIDLFRAKELIDAQFGPGAKKPGTPVNLNIPATAEYEIGEGVSNPTLNELTEQKLRLIDRDYYAKYGQHLYITSMSRDGDGSSWHDSGQAIDTADDNLETSKEARDWLVAQGEKYGLYALDEYENPSEHATGGHIHFSDHGEALEGGGESVSAYDPERRDKLYRMVAAQEQAERSREKKAEEDRMNAMKNEIAGAGDYGTAAQYIAGLDVDNDARRRLTSYAAYIYHEPSSAGGERSGGKPYNPKKDIKTLDAFNTAITMGENLTAEKWTNMRAAADAILQNGVLTDEAQEQIEDILNDERKWSQITAALDNGKDVEDIRDVFMNAGMSAEVALIILSRIDDRYL